MENIEMVKVCGSCGFSGSGNYCSHCGQPFVTKRITLAGLLHEIFHLFTHLDKGFGFTLKQLVIAPGDMQRRYIEGNRSNYQKPFSMFFICATIAALSRYWIYGALMKFYHVGDASEVSFVHEYMVMVHIALLPVQALIIYLFFYKAGYNYAEIGVMVLYSVSFFLLIATLTSLLKFFWLHLDTAYVELPFLLIYNVITFLNFFNKQPRWIVAIKSFVIFLCIFFLFQVIEDFVIELIS